MIDVSTLDKETLARNELAQKLADHQVEVASQKDLIRAYWDDAHSWYSSCDIKTLKVIANDIGVEYDS